MKQTDIYTKALICLRSILQTDHPEFKNWIGWLERDIEDWIQRREVSHHLRAYGGIGNEEKIYNAFEVVCQWMDKILIPKMNELCTTE